VDDDNYCVKCFQNKTIVYMNMAAIATFSAKILRSNYIAFNAQRDILAT